MAGYPPLPWEYSGIIGDFTHWHLFFNFLQMSESEPAAAPPHKSKYLIIIKDIFLSSFKDFSFDRTQCTLLFFQLISAQIPNRGRWGRGMATNIRFQRHKEREYSPAGDSWHVTRSHDSHVTQITLLTVTGHSNPTLLTTPRPQWSWYAASRRTELIRSLTWQIMKRKWSSKTVPMAMAPVVVGTSLQLEKFYSHLIRRQFHH